MLRLPTCSSQQADHGIAKIADDRYLMATGVRRLAKPFQTDDFDSAPRRRTLSVILSVASEERLLAEREMTRRILSLLGGGAKGIFTLGVLEGVEAQIGRPLAEHFDLIAGTSKGQ
jgi:hypothetical protein